MGLSPEMRAFVRESVGHYKDNELTNDVRLCLERSAGLVKVAAGNRKLDDDTLQACMAHLCYVATKFDPTRGVKWSTFAVNCLKRWFIKEWRADSHRIKTLNGVKSKLDGTIDDICKFVPDRSESSESQYERRDDIDAMVRMVDTLPQREREVLYARYGLRGGSPMLLGDVGRMQGVGKERARQLESRAIKMLQAKLGRKESVC